MLRTQSTPRFVMIALVAGAMLLPAACDTETAPKVMVVATDTNLPASAIVTHAIAGTPFIFTGGAGALSSAVTGQNMTVTFGGTETAATTTFLITPAAGGATNTVVATTTFGSCIFVISQSTFPTGHALSLGQIVTVNPCNMNVGTAGAVANGVGQSRSIALLLGAASSANASVTIAVNAGGQLTLNGNSVGTVTLTPVSG